MTPPISPLEAEFGPESTVREDDSPNREAGSAAHRVEVAVPPRTEVAGASGCDPSPWLAANLDHFIRMSGIRAVELRQRLRARGYPVSMAYLSQLRRGARTNPAGDLLVAIAAELGLEPAQLLALARQAVMTGDDAVLARLHDTPLRSLLLAAAGLSEESLTLLTDTADAISGPHSSHGYPRADRTR